MKLGRPIQVFALVALAGCASDDGSESPKAVWTRCYGDFECASIEVPVDYAAPDGAKIALAVLRAPATNPKERIGTVFVNPGGPGGAMVERVAEQYTALQLGFGEALQRLDVIAFDWRGIGLSSPIQCGDASVLDAIRKADLGLGSPSSVAAVEAARAGFVAACASNPAQEALLRNLTTESAARDIDRIREAIGEETINYLGFSYGTWLGATYATLFPNRVRAMVLDAGVRLPADLHESVRIDAPNRAAMLDRFFAACAADATSPFHGGATKDDVAAAYDALFTKIAAAPIPTPAGRVLGLTDAELAVNGALQAGNEKSFATALANAESGDATALLKLADAGIGRRVDGTYDTSAVGLLTIGCGDLSLPEGSTVESYRTFLTGLEAAPRAVHGSSIPWAICAGWPYRRTTPPVAIGAPTAPPALVIGTVNDPITPYSDSGALRDALGNGSHLFTYDGDGHIAALHSQCVRDVLTRFLVDPKAPLAKTSCPAD